MLSGPKFFSLKCDFSISHPRRTMPDEVFPITPLFFSPFPPPAPPPGASLLANGQLNGSGSKSGHKDDGSLRSQGLDGGKYSEDGPAKKR